MTRYLTPMAACLALAAPATLHAQAQDDGEIDLEAIDSLFEDEAAAEDEPGEDAGDAEDEGEAGSGEDATSEDEADGEASEEEEEAPEPSALTIAFNSYSNCASEAGAELEETGFALDVIGDEALLRCSGQRAAYVNAFYFSMLPRYPDANEATVRASAERLAAQSDAALAVLIQEEATARREGGGAGEETAEESADNGTEALSMAPFEGEAAATEAREFLLYCIETNPGSDCTNESATLTAALTDIFERNPELLAEGDEPASAAQAYVEAMKNGASTAEDNSPEDETDSDA